MATTNHNLYNRADWVSIERMTKYIVLSNPPQPIVHGRVRTCDCNEVGIDENGIIMFLLRQQYPNYHLVEKCTHWVEF